jgi:putative ABC transport system permease protein
MKNLIFQIRLLKKNKTASIINIFGLAIGIASFVILMLYVNYEKSYDKFYKNSDNIYRVYVNYIREGSVYEQDANTYNKTGEAIIEYCPEVKNFTRTIPLWQCGIQRNGQTFEIEHAHLADNSFFELFGYSLTRGNISTALLKPNSIVLTKSQSNRLFGLENPIGKTVEFYGINKKLILTVTGIMEDIPENTHMPINYLISFNTSKQWGENWELNWNNNNYYTYILTDKKLDIQTFNIKLKELDFPGRTREYHSIEPLTDIHLHSNKSYEVASNGNSRIVHLLMTISIVIVLLSWINYSNYLINQSVQRAKEAGIKKISGASKRKIIMQFMGDTFLTNVIAIVISIVMLPFFIYIFNHITDDTLNFKLIPIDSLIFIITFIFLGSVVSGLYPSIIVSRFQPASIIKGNKVLNSRFPIKKALVTFQFSLTIILIICSLTIFKQLKFLQDQPMGFNTDQILVLNGSVFNDDENMEQKFSVLKEKLKKLPFVNSVATAHSVPGQGFTALSSFSHLRFPNGTLDENTMWYNFTVDKDFLDVMNIEMLAGDNFDGNKGDVTSKILINEKTMRMIGINEPSEAVGQRVKFWGKDWIIKGVIRNYHHFGLNRNTEPFIIRYEDVIPQFMLIKLNGTPKYSLLNNNINTIKEEWDNLFSKSFFKYYFIDEQIETLYSKEKKFSRAFGMFTILSLLIASLGLWSLTNSIIINRTKEIGVRKVNGAKVKEIMIMLNRSYVSWITLSLILAVPVSFFIMDNWLEDYAFKTSISWWIFLIAGLLTVLTSLMTVSYSSMKAATRNPVDSLKYE